MIGFGILFMSMDPYNECQTFRYYDLTSEHTDLKHF